MPPSKGDFKENPQPQFKFNSIQIPANWNADNQDIWTFDENQMS